ncbi:hypothetical protein SAMN04244567_03210 [Paracoccus pantotrophus]|nr:hypothetical protein SAMN04244567_03210 [Paracoccus pantotrophus]
MNGRTVPAELRGNLRNAELALQHGRDDAALIEAEMRGQKGFSVNCNCLKTMACRDLE